MLMKFDLKGIPLFVLLLLLPEFFGQRKTCERGSSCIPIRNCNSLVQLLKSSNPNRYVTARKLTCNFTDGRPNVCCSNSGPVRRTPATPQISSRNLLPDQCGQPNIQDRIIGGLEAGLGSNPWIALVSFDVTYPDWFCGGALISERYVVTAAHCTLKEYTLANKDGVNLVRFGEHNLLTKKDCQTFNSGREICADSPRDVLVEEVIRHPSFNDRGSISDDIALLRLQEPVKSTAYISPICLPTSGAKVGSKVQSAGRTIVAGWGKTDAGRSSQVLLYVDVPYVPRSTCGQDWKGLNILNEQICFGGVKGKDSCNGDSGGPLIHPREGSNPPYDLIGIVSFGDAKCGKEGIPAVYTNIGSYYGWILQNMRP